MHHPRRHSRLAGPALVLGLAFSGTTLAQQQEIIPSLGRASHVVIPQTRSVPLRGQVAVTITGVKASIEILEQTARTTLQIDLHNPGSGIAESVLLLPVPPASAVSGFMFQGAAAEPTAQLLGREEARRLYDQIVATVRDPALLEFAGYNLVRTSVFPVPAGGTQRLRLSYEHVLPADGNRFDYLLPRSESLRSRVPWQIQVDVRSTSPISTVYSPSHELVIDRRNPGHLRATLAEASRKEPGSFRLSTLLERDGVTASMLAYPDPSVGGGYFLLMAGLPASTSDAAPTVSREVTIVIDRSGSMAGEKMDQVRDAALQVIEGLEDGEAFNIIDYSTKVSMFAPQAVMCSRENALAAREYLARIRPGGGTNIHDAILEALRVQPRDGMLPIALFLTDGLPTVGRTNEVTIRDLVDKANTHGRRVFTFGVGNDVNAPLLDRIALLSRAATTYVQPDEDVEVKVAQVFRRLYGPVFADVALTVRDTSGGASTRLVQEVMPDPLPDLFAGDQLILLGQYRDERPITFDIAGSFRGGERTFTYTFDMTEASTQNAFVPRLWASRRIAMLVDEVRQAGAELLGRPIAAGENLLARPEFEELAGEILRLSTEFGILTEYTSFLATEGTDLSNWNDLVIGCSTALDSKAVRTRAGKGAVNQSLNWNEQKAQVRLNYDNHFYDESLSTVAFSNVQQIADRAFFRRGGQWIDGHLINQQAGFQPDQTVTFGSPEHQAILAELISEGRQGVISLDGEILLRHDGRTICVKNTATDIPTNIPSGSQTK